MLPRGSPLLRPVVGVVGQVVAIDITDYVLHETRLYGLQALPQQKTSALFVILVLRSLSASHLNIRCFVGQYLETHTQTWVSYISPKQAHHGV